MKQLIYNFIFLGILTIVFSSCEDKTIVTYHETGEKYEEFKYIADSLKHGRYRKYSPEGILLETSNYVNGKLEGERIIYNYQNGVKEVSEIYKNDLLEGRHLVFHANGEVQSMGVYKNNVLSGTVKFFDTSGVLKNEFQFVNNFEVIPFQEFHENGNLKWEGTKRYDHWMGINKDYGELKEYNEEGILIRKIMCDEKEICTTTWSVDGSHVK